MTRVAIRRATEDDSFDIVALVRTERLNPFDLDWRSFMVAVEPQRIVGAAQLRRHGDGSRELGSLVVRPDVRGQGIASRLIDTLVSTHDGRNIFMITGAMFARHYARWGFRPMPSARAPWPVLRNYWLGRLAGVQSWLVGRDPKELAVLERRPVVAPWRSQGSSPAV